MKSVFMLLIALSLSPIPSARGAETLFRQEWTVDGVVREALVYAPSRAKTEATPVVFVFHGHGGTMRHAARVFALHTRWPEALVVYPQGSWEKGCMLYPSKVGASVVTFIHSGAHQFPTEAPAIIVKFFKEHAIR